MRIATPDLVTNSYFPTLAANATAIWSDESGTRIASGGISNCQNLDHTRGGATLSQRS